MRKRVAAGTVIVILAILLAAASYQMELSNGEIFVSKVPVEGASYPRVRVEAVIDAPPPKVWNVIRDCAASGRINSRVAASSIVKQSGDTVVCSETIAMPFPFRDLTSVARWRLDEGPPVWTRSWTLIRGDFDYSNGSWTLRSFDGGRTLAVYQNHFSPHMKVPDWLVKGFLKVGMTAMIEDLRAAVR